MTRQGENFVIPSRWIKVTVAVMAVMVALGPTLGAGLAYIVRDVGQSKDIENLKFLSTADQVARERDMRRLDARLDRIEALLMERPK